MSTVLFDFDGTLADTAEPLAELMGLDDASPVRDLLADPAGDRPLVDQLAEGGETADGDRLVEELGRRASVSVRLYPGVYRALLRLVRGGDRAALFTRWPEALIGEFLAETGLDGYLEPVISVPASEELAPPVRALEMLGAWLRERETGVWGDPEDSDGAGSGRAPSGDPGNTLADRGPPPVEADGHAIAFVSDGTSDLEAVVASERWGSVKTLWIRHGYGSRPSSGSDGQLDRVGELFRFIR